MKSAGKLRKETLFGLPRLWPWLFAACAGEFLNLYFNSNRSDTPARNLSISGLNSRVLKLPFLT